MLLSLFFFFFFLMIRRPPRSTLFPTRRSSDLFEYAAKAEVQAMAGALEANNLKLVSLHGPTRDRKSTRLNSSHGYISYAVFCLKKKKQNNHNKNSKYI